MAGGKRPKGVELLMAKNSAVGSQADTPQTEPDSKTYKRSPFQPGRTCYFILGMHRSGTSAVAGTITKLGATPPAHLLGPHEGNQLGHWESQPLMVFHEELLASAGTRWDDWREFNDHWYDTPVAKQFKERASHLLEEEFSDSAVFVFKDPRNCRIARFWLEIFAERGITPKIVLPIRSPLEVAQSHRARDGFPLRKGLLLWLRHVLDAEATSRDMSRTIIEYDGFLKDWRSTIATMELALGPFPANTELTAAEVDTYLRGDLKRQRVSRGDLERSPLIHAWVVQVYDAMRELASNPGSNSAREALDQVRARLGEASMLFGGVLADMETSHTEVEQRLREDAVAKAAAAQQERDALKTQLEIASTRANQLQESVRDYESQMEQIKRSLSWRVISALNKLRIWGRR